MGGLGAGAAPGLTEPARAPHHSTEFVLGSFLPSPQRVSVSCFHFQWLGILGVGKGERQHVPGVIYSSAYSVPRVSSAGPLK